MEGRPAVLVKFIPAAKHGRSQTKRSGVYCGTLGGLSKKKRLTVDAGHELERDEDGGDQL